MTKSSTEEHRKAAWGQYGQALRKTKSGGRNGGRPATYVPCPRCGERVTKTQARRGHGCAK